MRKKEIDRQTTETERQTDRHADVHRGREREREKMGERENGMGKAINFEILNVNNNKIIFKILSVMFVYLI